MHIKEIILEGFKSYSTRTVISGFDSKFNAITGLNGSGKSNILDAILFVLGLSQLSMARVNTLQELVYKLGHAGVTKAQVSIIFDNTNKAQSPRGYEDFDNIIVMRQISQGKSKYFLNGQSQPQTRIKDLFKSVQLNIDTPHFLVAQGKITKIINLKPQDLIAMLEETAGTSLYNDKRKESKRLMEKKEEKLKEIDDLLSKEINPQMEKLKKEKEQYFIWKSGEQELNSINKKIRAFEYLTFSNQLTTIQEEDEKFEKNQVDYKNKKEKIDKEVAELEVQHEKFVSEYQGKDKSEMKAMQEKFAQLQKQITTQESELENLKKTVNETQTEMDLKDSTLKQLRLDGPNLIQKIEFLNNNIEQMQQNFADKKQNFEEIKRNIQAIDKGDNVKDNGLQLINTQIKKEESTLFKLNSEIKTIETKINYNKNELSIYKQTIENAQQEKNSIESQKKLLEQEINALVDDITKIGNNDNQISQEKSKFKKLEEEVMQISHKITQMQDQFWYLKLNFNNPEPGFDRNRVKGRVLELVSPKEDKFKKALEAVCGNRLQNIVVDNEVTAKLLMKKKSFGNYWVTLLPNNKMDGKPFPQDVVQRAAQIATQLGGQAVPAYNLIDFNPDLKNTMLYVFGNTFICSSPEIAKKITFSEGVKKRSVTLDGDIYDPQGTLTGGFQNERSNMFSIAEEFNKLKHQYDEKKREFQLIENQIQILQRDQDYMQSLQKQLDNKQSKLDMIKEKQRRNSNAHLQTKNDILENEIKTLIEQLEIVKKQEQQTAKEIEKLQKEQQDFNANSSQNMNKDQQKKMWENKKKSIDQELKEMQKSIKEMQNQLTKCETQQTTNETTIKRYSKDFDSKKENLHQCETQKKDKEIALVKLRKEYQKLEEEKQKMDIKIAAMDHKIQQIKDRLNEQKSNKDYYEKELKKIETTLVKNLKELNELQNKLSRLETTYPFILNDKDLFGLPETEYDFSKFQYEQSKAKYQQLKQDQDNMKKKVNMKVESMYEKVEKEFNSLGQKREIISKDKLTLDLNISELDIKKKEALEKCYLIVNKNFGKIFSTLLPFTDAKIQQIPGKDLTEGLEIGVAFNNVWKNSLSELSGGQRSLLALSFMLSLLLYKPAPFYVLDEIDAALDLSHTENIGQMISKHFPQSQFVIISLKEGMFNNANVLFKTTFIDGISKVDRVALKKKEEIEKKQQQLQKTQKNQRNNQQNKMEVE